MVEKIINLPGGQINDPKSMNRGNTIFFRSSQQLPRLCLGPMKGFFELARRPSSALNSPPAVLRYKDIGVAY